ncbi:F-box/LRR-repeat protein 6 [Bufo bufo]|uniref:F-box/LRR-repeat protein 6 n=1 Tax=Bufo bufo TaxID=8384 RepID=UPI001ABDCAC5|nr:F-box/LRR-repeat protein 6 [Bufo bufo]
MASRRTRGPHPGKRVKQRGKKRRPPAPDYYVHHTDRDMLLLIPSEMEETVTVVKRVRRAEDASPPVTTDSGWGSVVPHEIIHRVFRLVADSEGAVPALCRLGRVCRLWHQVASSPDLWQRVSVSRCWIIPSKKDPPRIRNKVKNTIEAVIQQRFSQVCDFTLQHWTYHSSVVLQSLSSSCPLLTSLTLSHCSNVTVDGLVSVGERCPHLTSLNLQDSQVDSHAVARFLGVRGATLRCLYLPFSCQTNNILNLLASGSCPELRLLEVNRGMKETMSEVHVYAEGLQASCPKLEVLRLLNFIFSLKSRPSSSVKGPGFSHLQEICLATSTYSIITDSTCSTLLRDCTKLRVLDLRGCYRVSPESICELPCTDLQHLYLGMYLSAVNRTLPSAGCSLLTRRWRHSLQELDLTGLNFSDSDLSQALGILSEGGVNDMLQSLNLTGTKVPAAAVRDVLSSCQTLTHLDLTSCRNIPRGMRCVYRGREDILQCLKTLCTRMQETGI